MCGLWILFERPVGEFDRFLIVERCLIGELPEHLERLLSASSVVPAVNQIELHPYFQQRAVQRLDAEHGILTQAWSPIGGITSYRAGGKSAFDDPTLRRSLTDTASRPPR